MTKEQIKEMLEKQLQLLSEQSRGIAYAKDLAELTEAMLEVSQFLLQH